MSNTLCLAKSLHRRAFQPVPRVCTAQHRWTHHSVGAQWVAMPHLLEQQRGLCSLLPSLSIFLLLLWGRKGPLSGKNIQALIIQRGTGVGGAPYHHSPPPPDLCKTVSFSPGAMALWEGRHSCHTNTANTDTAAHALPHPETRVHSRISCPKASFLQLFPLDATTREKQTAELSPAMASLHVLKSSIWKCSIHIGLLPPNTFRTN